MEKEDERAYKELKLLMNFLATKKSIKVLNVSKRYDLRNHLKKQVVKISFKF